jgi:competence protein ComEC
VAGLFAAVFGRLLGKRKGAVAAALGIGVYALLVGGDPAVIRAAILGGLALFASQVGRRQDGLTSLAFAAALMALANPYVLWDVGFQLSFAATLGLVLYAGPLVEVFVHLASRWLPLATAQAISGPVGEYFLFTLAAQVTTLPLIVYYFQRLSLSAFVANPLILPAQPPVMILGGLAVILATLFQPLGKLAAPLVYPFVLYTVRLVEWVAAVFGPGLYLGAVALPLVIGFYTLLFSGTHWIPRLRQSPLGERLANWLGERGTGLRSMALVGLLILTVLIWRAAYSAPDGRLHATFLDVGNGEAVLIQSPGGRYVLVNGGSSASRLSDGLGRRLPAFSRYLDALLIGSPGEEQIGALSDILPRFPPGMVLWAGPTNASSEARFLQQTLSEAGLYETQAETGQSLDLGDGAPIEVLAVSQRGAVLLLEYGSFRLLLPLGIDFELIESLQDDPQLKDLPVLLLADSGYGPSNPPEWLDKLNPQLVLLSVAADDYQGRPDSAVLEAVEGRNLLRTDRDGWIEVETDGEQMWVEAEKK